MIPALDLSETLNQLGVDPTTRLQVMDLEGMKALNREISTRQKEDVQAFLRWSVLSSNVGFWGNRGLTLQRDIGGNGIKW